MRRKFPQSLQATKNNKRHIEAIHLKLKALFCIHRVRLKECGACGNCNNDIIKGEQIRADSETSSSWEDSTGLYGQQKKIRFHKAINTPPH